MLKLMKSHLIQSQILKKIVTERKNILNLYFKRIQIIKITSSIFHIHKK